MIGKPDWLIWIEPEGLIYSGLEFLDIGDIRDGEQEDEEDLLLHFFSFFVIVRHRGLGEFGLLVQIEICRVMPGDH